MKLVRTLVLLGFVISPAFAQNAPQAPQSPSSAGATDKDWRAGVTYEDCETRCKECGTGRNPDCVKNFCTGYPRRKPGAAPLPVVCPQTD
jgi:hypothetical protein